MTKFYSVKLNRLHFVSKRNILLTHFLCKIYLILSAGLTPSGLGPKFREGPLMDREYWAFRKKRKGLNFFLNDKPFICEIIENVRFCGIYSLFVVLI